ncbi:hypothetical protein SeLEV6574_g07840 [Synchytrium endobioticum]|nr:hypothetical protein SeLEV6574_g07840 [Synchytrium endobioticum]
MECSGSSSIVAFSRDEFLPGLSSSSSSSSPWPVSAAASFSPVTFIADHRHIPLDRLKNELNTALRQLKHELIDLINRDYADFISLSTNLTGVDAVIKDIGSPLEAMHSQVTWVRSSLQQVISQLETQLKARSHIREKKATVHLLLSIHESFSKVEELLGIASTTPINGPTSDLTISNTPSHLDSQILAQDTFANDTDGKLIERVAIEFNQLQYFVSRGANLPYVSNIEWRISRVKDTLTSNLSKALKAAYLKVIAKPNDATAATILAQYLRTYVLIDKIKDAQDIFNDAVVAPFVQKIILAPSNVSSNEFDPQAMPAISATSSHHKANNANNPAEIYQKIISFAKTECTPVLELSNQVFKGTTRDMLVDSVWATAVTGIMDRMSGITAVGLPDVFQKNYALAMDFVSQFEALCKRKKTLSLLRLHPVYVDFIKRWQLSVYFQLRSKEIYGKMEVGCTSFEWIYANLKLDPSSPISPFVLAPSNILLNCIRTCFDDGVFLWSVSYRLWKLTLQLIGRYVLFLKMVLSQVLLHVARKPKDGARKSTDTAASASSGTPTATTTAGVADEVILKRLSGMYRDCVLTNEQESVRCTYGPPASYVQKSRLTSVSLQITLLGKGTIAPRIIRQDQQGPSALSTGTLLSILEETLEPLHTDLRLATSQHIIDILSSQCTESLRSDIFNIPGQYRRTNKEPPTRPSYYVASILEPVSAFVSDCSHLFPSPPHSGHALPAEWATAVLNEVTSTFTAQAVEMLESQKKISESLKRLRRGGATDSESAGNGVAMSDDDKIRLQVVLDVRQLGVELQGRGMDVSTSEKYRELLKVVAPFLSLAESIMVIP